MKKVKNNQGITLIALVITIVVLIILATVSINMILNDNGIIGAAELAKDKYQDAAKTEERELSDVEELINSNIPKKAYTIGQKVYIGEEGFYVIADSGENEEMVTLLAENCIDSSNTQFSETNYWAGDFTGTSYDLIERGVPDSTHTAGLVAYNYGKNLGGTGRLMKKSEAVALKNGGHSDILMAEDKEYWLCTAISTKDLAVVRYNGSIGQSSIDDADWDFSVRPVVEVSKDKINDYRSFEEGQVVNVQYNGNTYNYFIILKDSDGKEDKVTLLTPYPINPSTLSSVPYGNTVEEIEFSETNYWSEDFTTSPYDLTEKGTGLPDSSHTAALVAYNYGSKIGGKGRLLTYEEGILAASHINGTSLPIYHNEGKYWIASASSESSAYVIDMLHEGYYRPGSEVENKAEIRVAIEISKELVTLDDMFN